MKAILRQLLDLGDLDKRAHELRKQLALYPKMLAEMQAKEDAAAKRAADAAAAIKRLTQKRLAEELEIKTLQTRVERYLQQQNQVKSNKEFEAITHEIAQVRGEIDRIETAALEGLEEEERLTGELKSAKAEAERIAPEFAAERARIAKQEAEKRNHLEALMDEREGRVEAVPDEFRETYVRLNARYPGQALVAMGTNSCGGCGMQLVPQIVREIRNVEKIIRCPGCMRILYDALSMDA